MDTSSEVVCNKLLAVLAALRCWWKIALPLSVVCAGAAAATLLLLHKPMYTSEAWLMITPQREAVLMETRADSQKFIQNQIQIIRSPRLLRPLMANPEIVTTPELLQDRIDLTLSLSRRLSVRPRGDSDMYVVSFTSESAPKAEIIVRSVVDAYLAHNDQEERKQGLRMIKTLTVQGEKRYREMAQLRDKVKEKAILITGVDPFRPGTKKEESAKTENPFAELQSEIIRMQVEQDVLAATIEAEQSRQSETKSEPSEKEIEKEIELQPSYAAQKTAIERLETREADFLRNGNNLATNPAYKQLQASLVSDREKLAKLRTSLHDDIKDSLASQSAAAAEARLKQLRDQHETAAVRLKVLNDKFTEGMRAAKQFTGDTLDLEFLRAKLHQVTAINDAINNRILAIQTEKEAPSRVDLYQEASRPTQPDEIYPWKKIGMGAGMAFLLPLALCVAWEHFFRRVSSRSQVETMQQLVVVGEVTALPTRSRQPSFDSRSSQREVMLFEESIDSLRTFLRLSQNSRNLRVVAVTSAVSGEGKTSLAAQLAICIARATRQPTLLIDGDLRSPDIHNIFKIEMGPGLAEVLRHECPLEEAIDISYSERLHILTAGRLRTNPHRLLGGDDFEIMLNRLKGTYRHIIIDTPPILPASESLVFAQAADTAILCMRRDYSRMAQSQAAHARMAAAGVHVSGAVLNGIPMRQYAYQYGTYEISNV